MERYRRSFSLARDAYLSYQLATLNTRSGKQTHPGYGADCFHPDPSITPTPGGCQAFAAEKVAVLTEQGRINLTESERKAQWSIVQFIKQTFGWIQ